MERRLVTVCWLFPQSKGKYAGKIMKKKTKEEKESSPFNVFMKTELLRLKQVTWLPNLACCTCCLPAPRFVLG